MTMLTHAYLSLLEGNHKRSENSLDIGNPLVSTQDERPQNAEVAMQIKPQHGHSCTEQVRSQALGASNLILAHPSILRTCTSLGKHLSQSKIWLVSGRDSPFAIHDYLGCERAKRDLKFHSWVP